MFLLLPVTRYEIRSILDLVTGNKINVENNKRCYEQKKRYTRDTSQHF